MDKESAELLPQCKCRTESIQRKDADKQDGQYADDTGSPVDYLDSVIHEDRFRAVYHIANKKAGQFS